MPRRNNSNTPRRKRMNRRGRLDAAPGWLEKYDGNNVARGYRDWFGVDWACAFNELELLGIDVDPDYKCQVLRDVKKQREAKRRRKETRSRSNPPLFGWNSDFACVAGYTSGGAPFGLRWEDWEGPHPRDEDDEEPLPTDDDWPF